MDNDCQIYEPVPRGWLQNTYLNNGHLAFGTIPLRRGAYARRNEPVRVPALLSNRSEPSGKLRPDLVTVAGHANWKAGSVRAYFTRAATGRFRGAEPGAIFFPGSQCPPVPQRFCRGQRIARSALIYTKVCSPSLPCN